MRQKTIWLLIGIVLACAGGLWFYFGSDFSHGGLLSREVATRVMAEHLARQFPKQKVLVVSSPFTQKKGQPRPIYLYEEAGIRGLQKGLGQDRVKVCFPALQEGALEEPHSFQVPPTTTTPVAFLLAEAAFDTLAQKHPNCDLIVSLIGFPPDLRKLQLWQRADGPKLAFLLPDLWMLGDKEAIAKAFKTGKIAAVVVNKPGVSNEQVGASAKDFDKLYLLLTPENIEEVMTKFPQLFESSDPLEPDEPANK